MDIAAKVGFLIGTTTVGATIGLIMGFKVARDATKKTDNPGWFALWLFCGGIGGLIGSLTGMTTGVIGVTIYSILSRVFFH